MKKQVLESPFTKKEFLDLVDQISEPHDIKHEDFAISKTSIVNIGSREFVDYRPSIALKKEILEKSKINSVDFDSLHFFQIHVKDSRNPAKLTIILFYLELLDIAVDLISSE